MSSAGVALQPGPKTRYRLFSNPHFWSIILILAFLMVFYYQGWFFGHRLFYGFWILEITEYNYNFIGSLSSIPVIYSAVIFKLRGALITWAAALLMLLPKILTFRDDPISHLTNIFYLLIPLLVVAFLSIELSWREKERRNMAKREAEKEIERQNYLVQIFKAQEDERKRIAQEIHDDSIQRLAGVASIAQIITHNQDIAQNSRVKDQIVYLKDTIISISQDLRRLSIDLRPTVLDDLGLVLSLYWLVERFEQESGVKAELVIKGDQPEFSPKVTVQVFRIVQEALNNIRKYAGATRVTVTLEMTPALIQAFIQDNGRGFEVPARLEQLGTQGKLGLIGMQQRVQALNGSFQISSGPQRGTLISVRINL